MNLEIREKQYEENEATQGEYLNYVAALNNVIWGCMHSRQFERAPEYIRKLTSIETDSTAVQIQIRERELLFTLILNRMLGTMDASPACLEQCGEFLEENEHLNEKNQNRRHELPMGSHGCLVYLGGDGIHGG